MKQRNKQTNKTDGEKGNELVHIHERMSNTSECLLFMLEKETRTIEITWNDASVIKIKIKT